MIIVCGIWSMAVSNSTKNLIDHSSIKKTRAIFVYEAGNQIKSSTAIHFNVVISSGADQLGKS